MVSNWKSGKRVLYQSDKDKNIVIEAIYIKEDSGKAVIQLNNTNEVRIVSYENLYESCPYPVYGSHYRYIVW